MAQRAGGISLDCQTRINTKKTAYERRINFTMQRRGRTRSLCEGFVMLGDRLKANAGSLPAKPHSHITKQVSIPACIVKLNNQRNY